MSKFKVGDLVKVVGPLGDELIGNSGVVVEIRSSGYSVVSIDQKHVTLNNRWLKPADPAVEHQPSVIPPNISLRDWLAGQAMLGILSGSHPVCRGPEPNRSIPDVAYKMADAMLRARDSARGVT